MEPTREQILEALRGVHDREILGLVYDLAVRAGWVTVRMTMISTGCPAGDYLVREVRQAAASVPGVQDVYVKLI